MSAKYQTNLAYIHTLAYKMLTLSMLNCWTEGWQLRREETHALQHQHFPTPAKDHISCWNSDRIKKNNIALERWLHNSVDMLTLACQHCKMLTTYSSDWWKFYLFLPHNGPKTAFWGCEYFPHPQKTLNLLGIGVCGADLAIKCC